MAVVRGLEEDLAGRFRFVYRNFPLAEIHPHALQAAEAAEAAGAQDRFWDMHELLFAHQKALATGDLLKYAAELHLDTGRLAGDLTARTHIPRIQRDLDSGESSSVQGTPTLFIGDRKHEGRRDRGALLAALQAAGAWTLAPDGDKPRLEET
jgi:protein-disulfide isomerase